MGTAASQGVESARQRVAVFDLDGTCIRGQSGKLLSLWLFRHGNLSLSTTWHLSWWGARYLLHLPHRQERPRELIFRDLNQYDSAEIDRIMVEFHNEVMVPRYRKRAVDEVKRLSAEGCATVIISATFQTIADEAARYLGVDGSVATMMERDESGHYTGYVLGDVVEGPTKVRAVQEWANERFGEGHWELYCAYGDHYSDAELLQLAQKPVAVSPGPQLRRLARRNKWPIQNWNVD